MAIRIRLFMAFAASLVLMLLQLFVANLFLSKHQNSVEVVTRSVTAREAKYSADNALAQIIDRTEQLSESQTRADDIETINVLWDDLSHHVKLVLDSRDLPQINVEALDKTQSVHGDLNQQFAQLKLAVTLDDDDRVADESYFFSDTLYELQECLSIANVSLGQQLQLALVEEKRIHPLPFRVGICAFCLAAVLLTVFAWYFSRSFVRPIFTICDGVGRIAKGDLLFRNNLNRRDELGQLGDSVDRMADSLSILISEVESSTREVVQHSEQISMSSDAMSDDADRLTIAIRDVTEAMNGISTNASDAQTVAARAVDISDSTNRTIGRLSKSSADICGVVETIDSIAKQTNLLALNAAIEATRAGAAGTGFRVVAHEVKELAGETSQATDEIHRRVSAIRTDMNNSIDLIAQIESIVDEINGCQNRIATAVEEQTICQQDEAAQKWRVGKANISSVAAVAESTSTRACGVKESTYRLSSTAEKLQALIDQFQY